MWLNTCWEKKKLIKSQCLHTLHSIMVNLDTSVLVCSNTFSIALLPFCLQKWFSTWWIRVWTDNRSSWLVICRWTLFYVFLTAKSKNVVLSTDVLCLSILLYAWVVRCLSNSKSRNVNMSSDKDLYRLLCDFQMEGLHLHWKDRSADKSKERSLL